MDHSQKGRKPGATVTPIRPQIQLADTTPFGITPPGPTLPSEDADTWGGSPRRRMQADGPTDHRIGHKADDRDVEKSAAAGAGAIPPNDTYTDDDLDGTRQAIRHRRPKALGLWRGAAALGLIALLSAATALMSSGAPTTSPQIASSKVSPATHQPSPALPSLLTQRPTRSTFSRRHPPKSNRPRQPRRIDRQHDQANIRRHGSQHRASSPANDSYSTPPQTVTYKAAAPAPVASPARPTQTVTVTGTGTTSSGGQAGATPPTSTQPTAPAGPTGSSALIGPGHCSC